MAVEYNVLEILADNSDKPIKIVFEREEDGVVYELETILDKVKIKE